MVIAIMNIALENSSDIRSIFALVPSYKIVEGTPKNSSKINSLSTYFHPIILHECV